MIPLFADRTREKTSRSPSVHQAYDAPFLRSSHPASSAVSSFLMASSEVVMIRDSSSSTTSIQQRLLSPPFLCDRVRMPESMFHKLAGTGYGATSSAAPVGDSPTHSPDPPVTFSEQEDEILRELVKRHGTKKWHIISAKMHKKTPRECRKRDTIHLETAGQKSQKWFLGGNNTHASCPFLFMNRFHFYCT